MPSIFLPIVSRQLDFYTFLIVKPGKFHEWDLIKSWLVWVIHTREILWKLCQYFFVESVGNLGKWYMGLGNKE